MTSHVRDVMSEGVECVGEDDSVLVAARTLADLQVGSVPIGGNDSRLKGMLTDRDIVGKVLARGLDPATVTAGSLAEGEPVTIGADERLGYAMQTMAEYLVWRLPVIDGDQLVGMLSQADLVKALPEGRAGELIQPSPTADALAAAPTAGAGLGATGRTSPKPGEQPGHSDATVDGRTSASAGQPPLSGVAGPARPCLQGALMVSRRRARRVDSRSRKGDHHAYG